eukprot:3925712-Prymnesium_polylepis.2
MQEWYGIDPNNRRAWQDAQAISMPKRSNTGTETRVPKKQAKGSSLAPAPIYEQHRKAITKVRKQFKAKIRAFIKTAGDTENPIDPFVAQCVASLKAVYVHVVTSGKCQTMFALDACESVLESLAYALDKAVDADPTTSFECVTDPFDFELTAPGEPAQQFSFGFHRPLLWVWRELLLTMAALDEPEERIVASIRRALLAPAMYDPSESRGEKPRHTLDLLLRGGTTEDWDNVDHLHDSDTDAQRKRLPQLISLCAAHGADFKYDKYDTYEYSNDEK